MGLVDAFSSKNPRDPSFRQLAYSETDIVEKVSLLKDAYEELIGYVDSFNQTQNPLIQLYVQPTYFLVMRHANDYAATMVQKECKGILVEDLTAGEMYDENDLIRSVLLQFGIYCNSMMKKDISTNPTPLTKYILEMDDRNNSIYSRERCVLVRPDIHGDNVVFNEEEHRLEIFDW